MTTAEAAKVKMSSKVIVVVIKAQGVIIEEAGTKR